MLTKFNSNYVDVSCLFKFFTYGTNYIHENSVEICPGNFRQLTLKTCYTLSFLFISLSYFFGVVFIFFFPNRISLSLFCQLFKLRRSQQKQKKKKRNKWCAYMLFVKLTSLIECFSIRRNRAYV